MIPPDELRRVIKEFITRFGEPPVEIIFTPEVWSKLPKDLQRPGTRFNGVLLTFSCDFNFVIMHSIKGACEPVLCPC